MGRPLKIRKYTNQGINGNQVDYGFPNNDGSTDNDFNNNRPGIVGGVDEDYNQLQTNASVLVKGLGTISCATNDETVTGTGTHFTTDGFADSQIWVDDGNGGYTSVGSVASTTNNSELELAANASVALTDSAWYYTIVDTASIVRQKGARKFMVATTDNNIQDESIAKGQAYMIADPGNTDWAALGAGINAGQYDIFTATKDGTGLTSDGYVWAVATCILVDNSTPTDPNTMRVAIYDDGDTYYASRIKNKFTINFTDNGDDENPGTEFIATFFNDNGNVDPATDKRITGTQNWD